jgi:hypothetical protein
MKNKRIMIAALFGLMLLSNQLFAQRPLMDRPAPERAKMQTQRMTTSLRLDSVQAEKVATINLKFAQKMDPVIQGNANRMSKLKAARALQNEKEGELKQVLTREQFEQFKQQQQEVKDEIRKHRKS